MSAVAFAFLSAVANGITNVFIRRAVIGVLDATIGVLITVPLSVVFYFLILIAIGQVSSITNFSWQSYAWMSAAGILYFIVGRSLNYNLVQLVGANISTILRQLNLIVAVILGISVLGESFSWQLVVGVLLIIVGLIVTGLNPQMLRSGRKLFSGIPSKAYLLGLGVGLSWGVSPIMMKLGLSDSNSPVAGAFIAMAAAAVVASTLLWKSDKRKTLVGMKKGTLGFFCLAGLLGATSGLMFFVALSFGAASVVTPLFNTTPIFTLFFSYVFNRKLEVFGPTVIIGIIAVVIGSILLI